MRGSVWIGAVVASSLLGAAPAYAKKKKPLPVPIAAPVEAPDPTPVGRFYQQRAYTPIWFREAGGGQAAATLVTILKRAPLDGLDNGQLLAAEVQAAIARASTGDQMAVRAAEKTLSNAWVSYVAAIEKPIPGMIYGDPAVRVQPSRPERVMYQLANAPSLVAHITSVSNVNPIYAGLRQAALQEAELPGGGLSAKVIANLERARGLPAKGRFVLVDVPSATLWMYEDGVAVDQMKVVVGMPQYPTPMVASMIHYTTFNPYWHVPDHLVVKTVAPNVVKQGPAYLKTRGYEVVSEWSDNAAIVPPSEVDWKAAAAGKVQVKVRQLPGGANSMGKMKFPFANGEGIYLHDTPDRAKFDKERRDLSNGCIRVERAADLARWLFGRQPDALTSKAPEQHVALGRGVPVYVTYLTAQQQDGKLVILDDPYGRDAAVATRSGALR